MVLGTKISTIGQVAFCLKLIVSQAFCAALQVDMCQRAYKILVERVGFDPQDIVFDPNILTVGTGLPEHNNYAVDFFRATRELKQVPLLLLSHVAGLNTMSTVSMQSASSKSRAAAGSVVLQFVMLRSSIGGVWLWFAVERVSIASIA